MEKIEELASETKRVKEIIENLGYGFKVLKDEWAGHITVTNTDFNMEINGKRIGFGFFGSSCVYINGDNADLFVRKATADEIKEVIIALKVSLDLHQKRINKEISKRIKELKTIE